MYALKVFNPRGQFKHVLHSNNAFSEITYEIDNQGGCVEMLFRGLARDLRIEPRDVVQLFRLVEGAAVPVWAGVITRCGFMHPKNNALSSYRAVGMAKRLQELLMPPEPREYQHKHLYDYYVQLSKVLSSTWSEHLNIQVGGYLQYVNFGPHWGGHRRYDRKHAPFQFAADHGRGLLPSYTPDLRVPTIGQLTTQPPGAGQPRPTIARVFDALFNACGAKWSIGPEFEILTEAGPRPVRRLDDCLEVRYNDLDADSIATAYQYVADTITEENELTRVWGEKRDAAAVDRYGLAYHDKYNHLNWLQAVRPPEYKNLHDGLGQTWGTGRFELETDGSGREQITWYGDTDGNFRPYTYGFYAGDGMAIKVLYPPLNDDYTVSNVEIVVNDCSRALFGPIPIGEEHFPYMPQYVYNSGEMNGEEAVSYATKTPWGYNMQHGGVNFAERRRAPIGTLPGVAREDGYAGWYIAAWQDWNSNPTRITVKFLIKYNPRRVTAEDIQRSIQTDNLLRVPANSAVSVVMPPTFRGHAAVVELPDDIVQYPVARIITHIEGKNLFGVVLELGQGHDADEIALRDLRRRYVEAEVSRAQSGR